MPLVTKKADSDNLEKLAKNSDRILKHRKRELVIRASIIGVVGGVVGYLLSLIVL